MIKGKPGEWYQDDSIGGYFNENGDLVVCVEFGTDADFDTHSVEVQNGDGYYNEDGLFISFSKDSEEWW